MGIWGAHAQGFLWALGIVTTLAFALPLTFVPLAWARAMRFSVPDDWHLTVYFGRCLGAFILVIEGLIFRGATDRAITPLTFQTLFAGFGAMLIVHLYGWLRRIQPITENLEIGMWAALIALAALFYPAG